MQFPAVLTVKRKTTATGSSKFIAAWPEVGRGHVTVLVPSPFEICCRFSVSRSTCVHTHFRDGQVPTPCSNVTSRHTSVRSISFAVSNCDNHLQTRCLTREVHDAGPVRRCSRRDMASELCVRCSFAGERRLPFTVIISRMSLSPRLLVEQRALLILVTLPVTDGVKKLARMKY